MRQEKTIGRQSGRSERSLRSLRSKGVRKGAVVHQGHLDVRGREKPGRKPDALAQLSISQKCVAMNLTCSLWGTVVTLTSNPLGLRPNHASAIASVDLPKSLIPSEPQFLCL